jgi:hypothetical protein
MENQDQTLLEEITAKCNALMTTEQGLDSVLSQIANDPQECPQMRKLASQILTGDRF